MDESSSSDATASERAQHEHTILSHMLTTPVRFSTKCHRNLLIKFCFGADLVEILVSTMAGNDRIEGFVSILRQFADSAKEGKSVDGTLFNKTCTDAVTLLLSSQVSDQGCSDLLHLLCCCPAYISSSTSMKTGVSIWTRIFSEAPQAVSLVVAELINAWKWTRDNKRGLFACEMIPNAKLRPLIVPGKPLSLPMMDPIEEIVVHRLFLGFFVDHFEVIYNNSFELLLKMISETMKSKDHFSHHPAAAGTFFSLMFLVLKFCSWEMKKNKRNLGEELHLLIKMVFRTALGWFAHEPEWFDTKDQDFARNEAQSVSMFVHLLDKPPTMENFSHISPFCSCIQPYCLNEGTNSLQGREHGSEKSSSVEGQTTKKEDFSSHMSRTVSTEMKGDVGQEEQKQLLLMLCHHEANRLHVWAQPATPKKNPIPHSRIASEKWIQYARTAFSVDPRIAFSMSSRFPTISSLTIEVTRLVQLHISELCEFPEALPFFVTPEVFNENSGLLQHLSHWAPCSIVNALQFLTSPYKGHLEIVKYVIGVLKLYPPTTVKFFMLQLVQALRYDEGKLVEGYLFEAAKGSDIFAHSLIWHLQGSNLHKKNKGDKHKNCPFEDALSRLRQKIIDSYNSEHQDWSHVQQELEFFDRITSISGVLVAVQMEERRDSIRSELEKMEVELKKIESEGINIYLPTATNKVVRGIQLDSGTPLQSATKVPIMVTFNVVDKEGNCHDEKPEACIFKVGDDCRQDVLAIQVISLLRDIFEAVGLDLYLFPYGVVPTGAERGIIEVVPNARSRSQLGKSGHVGLYEIFQEEYGSVGSPGFDAARDKFISSSAGYAVASFLLQLKDRNSGNLLFDNSGRLVHIDFGFLLGTSPAGNMGFERAHFKLSRGMTKLLDPSGVMKSDTWIQFVCLCVKGYLAARRFMNEIISPVQLMADSGLPCFKVRAGANATVRNFRRRFHPEMSERRAAKFMIRACSRAYNHWTTDAYDVMQNLQRSMKR